MTLHDEHGFKQTFIKLDFAPNACLTGEGPQEAAAREAWETVLHDMYFLCRGNDAVDSGRLTETHWGRIMGTRNQVFIVTGRLGVNANHSSSQALISADGMPDVLSPLSPFLSCAPIIINVCWESPLVFVSERFRFACDLNLFHLPTADEAKKIRATRRLDTAADDFDPSPPPSDLLAFKRGRLYSPEGAARSFSPDQCVGWLENKETYVHATFWTSREMSERYKDPTRENGPQSSWCAKSSYASMFARNFELAEREEGAVREEIQVDFIRWEELAAFDEKSLDERRSRPPPPNPFQGFTFIGESTI